MTQHKYSMNLDEIGSKPRDSIPAGVYDFINGLTPDDAGMDRVDGYRVHYEGFTDMCNAAADERCRLPADDPAYLPDHHAVYDEVLRDFIEREQGKSPIEHGLAGSGDNPIVYAVFPDGEQANESETRHRQVQRAIQKALRDGRPEDAISIATGSDMPREAAAAMFDRYERRVHDVFDRLMADGENRTYLWNMAGDLLQRIGVAWPWLDGIRRATRTDESWSNSYKKSINCSNPKGFSQKAHCAARRKRAHGGKTKSKPVREDMDLLEAKKRRAKTLIDGMVKTLMSRGRTRDEAVADLKKQIDARFYEAIDAFAADEILEENLRDWFKQKWVRFGPDGKIRGACARGSDSEGKPKCLPQKKAHSLGKKGRASAARRKRREDPNPERHGKAKNVRTKESIDESAMTCPHCGGMAYGDQTLAEKKDACYYKVKSRYKVWPSAYASGALVQCRKKGAKNWGRGKTNEGREDAVQHLMGDLGNRHRELARVGRDERYNRIDAIMQRVAKANGISAKELHDAWMDRFKELPDDWVLNEEKLTHRDPVEVWIRRFKDSTHPKFRGKTPTEREKMARMAHYRAVQNYNPFTSGSKPQVREETQPSPPEPEIRTLLNRYMDIDQRQRGLRARKKLQDKVWPIIVGNLDDIFADKGPKGDGDYPHAPFAAWLLVQHMDEDPARQVEFLNAMGSHLPNHPKLAFLRDRVAVNQEIMRLARASSYLDKNGNPLTHPTLDVRDPSKFDDAGMEAKSREEALRNAEMAGNKLLVQAVNNTNAMTQPSYQQVSEVKVRISKDPSDLGAYVDDDDETEPTINLGLSNITSVLEPDDLHDEKPGASSRIARMVRSIKAGKDMPPILVRRHGKGYQVLDGHHRFKAYRKAGAETIPARIVKPENITGDVDENFADGKGPGRPGDSQRHGIPKGATMAQLQKAAKAPGRKGQLARWQINMRRGRKKASEAIAPHGDPQNELRMLKAGTKPAALVNPWEFDTLYRPIADGMGWEVIEYTIPGFEGHRFYVVAQPGERDRAQRIVKLVKQANDTRISGEQIGPEYHRELGFLLGYKKDDVEHFIKNTYGDGKIDEGVWDTISDYGRTAASTVYGIGSAAADAAYDLGSKAVGSAAAFGRNAADVISLGGYKHARAYADYIAKQALKNIGYGSGSTYDRELKQEIEKLVRDDMDNPGAAGAGKLAGVVGAAAIPEIPVVGGIAGVGYKTAEVAHKVATAYKYAKQMLGLQEGEVVRTAFGTRQAAKNRTPYRFNPDIAASIPLYDPEKRFGVAHKRPEHAQGGEVPFDRFEVNHKSERTSDIVGIIGDRRVVVSTTRPDIAEVLADAYNRGGFTAADIEMVREDGADKQGAALTVFDMDETLFHTKARVYVVRDGEVLHRLTNQEYNTYQLKPGETYDYREFRDARFFHDTSVPIERMWRKAQNLLDNIGKRPGSRVIIVTARTDLDDRETFLNTFRKHGLDIDKVHVHRAGNLPVPAAAAKKAIIATYLNSGKFDSVRLIDDAESNLKSFLSLRSEYPDVRFTAYLVLPGGHMAQYQA